MIKDSHNTDELIAEIETVQALMANKDRTREEDDRVGAMVLRIARWQPSPSKLNAASILVSNPAERIARHVLANEKE